MKFILSAAYLHSTEKGFVVEGKGERMKFRAHEERRVVEVTSINTYNTGPEK
jgi:hypothetical protein